MDTGTGKTKIVLDTIRHLRQKQRIGMLVVIAPNKACPTWMPVDYPGLGWVGDVAKDWGAPDGPEPYVVVRQRSGSKSAAKALETVVKDPHTFILWVVGIELLSGKHHVDFLAKVLNTRLKAMATLRGSPIGIAGVVDESHYIQHTSAKRTRNILRLRNYFSVRRILTATPLGTGYENFFSQYAFTDPDIVGCQTYTEFKSTYCTTMRVQDKFTIITGYRNVKDLLDRIAPYTTYVGKEALHLPEPLRVREYVELSEQQVKAYEDLRDRFEHECLAGTLDEPNKPGFVIANLAITRLQRLQEVLSGFLRTEDKQVVRLEAPRVEHTVARLLEHPRKAMVWCRWKEDVERLQAALEAKRPAGTALEVFYGKYPVEERMRRLRAWQAHEGPGWLIATPDSAAESLTINEPDLVIWYSHVWRYLFWAQSDGRSLRIGQDKTVTFVDLCAAGRVDVRMLHRRAERQKMTADVFSRTDYLALLRKPAEYEL